MKTNKMITRTFNGFNVKFLTLNEDGTQEDVVIYIEGTDKEKAIKTAKTRMLGTGIFIGCDQISELKGMTLEDFNTHSVKVERPPSQRKDPKIKGEQAVI